MAKSESLEIEIKVKYDYATVAEASISVPFATAVEVTPELSKAIADAQSNLVRAAMARLVSSVPVVDSNTSTGPTWGNQ